MGETDKKDSAKDAEKGNSAVIPALILGIVGLGIGIAIGMFLPNASVPTVSDSGTECATEEKDEISRSDADEAIKQELNTKLDAFEMSSALNSPHLEPFYWKQLEAKTRIHTVFTYLRDSDLSDFVAAQKSWNSGDPIVKTVPIDRVKEVYKSMFGEEPAEGDFVSYISCSVVTGKFDYDSENKQYKITYAAGCGGYDREPADSYRDKFEVKGNTAYVTVELGSVSIDGADAYVVDDYSKTGKRLGEFDYNDSDFVNESTKDKFSKYQFIFDKKDGNWVLRGLYPLGVE